MTFTDAQRLTKQQAISVHRMTLRGWSVLCVTAFSGNVIMGNIGKRRVIVNRDGHTESMR